VMDTSSNTLPFDHTSTHTISIQSYATDVVFQYAQSLSSCSSSDCFEYLQALQVCVEEAVETGVWTPSLSLDVDPGIVQQALEALRFAARWKAEKERKESALRECFECLKDAAECGLEVFNEKPMDWEDWNDWNGVTEMHLGVLNFVQSLVDAQT